MPSIEANLAVWDRRQTWTHGGEEWSSPWGSVDTQWWGMIYPRIYQFVPAATILEIAPGFGRWTHYLSGLCRRLIAVDLSRTCIERCKERFARLEHIEYHVNNGCSLPMIEDGSIDFCFSFDSLVHCDAYILEGYLESLATKLSSDGIAFLHHSNMAIYHLERYQWLWRWIRHVHPRPFFNRVSNAIDFRVNPGWRATDLSAERFREACARVGLCCLTQEIINWKGWALSGWLLSDCISTIARDGSRWSRPTEAIVNRRFMSEAKLLHRLMCRPEADAGPG
jgi:methyltransferase family protein